MQNQVTHYDDMFSVCRVSIIGGSVWSFSIPRLASKDSERSSRNRLIYALPGYTLW